MEITIKTGQCLQNCNFIYITICKRAISNDVNTIASLISTNHDLH